MKSACQKKAIVHDADVAGSYLEGAAFEWWKGELKKSTADFKASAPMFWINLRNRFGNPEHWRVIEERLTFLQMKETDHFNRHLTTFENLASQTSWNKEALRARLYWSLSRRLREDLGLCDPATIGTLSTLKTRVLQTLGTRAQIPTGYMVKTLRSQSTCDSNMPSDQMLSTF